MPIIKSAKKRVKVAERARARNLRTKRGLRGALNAFAKALEGGKPGEIQKAQAEAVSALDTAVKKAVLHKNKAGRQKAALAARAKAAGVKPGSELSRPAAKAAAGKPTRKSTTKKPAVSSKSKAKSSKAHSKETAVKKAAAKKSVAKK